jgi:hypothetical protein
LGHLALPSISSSSLMVWVSKCKSTFLVRTPPHPRQSIEGASNASLVAERVLRYRYSLQGLESPGGRHLSRMQARKRSVAMGRCIPFATASAVSLLAGGWLLFGGVR